MAFNINNSKSSKSIIDILESTNKEITANLDLLAEDYLEKTGKKVCRSCPSDMQLMILELKNIYNMTQFRFQKPSVQYKNKKGDKTTISNSTMTDKKAIEFLKTNPERIRLFSEYPSNWEELLKGGKPESAKAKKARLAAEAEAEAVQAEKARLAAEAEANKKGSGNETETEAEKEARLLDEEEAEAIAAEKEALGKELSKQSLADLRKTYPEIKATSIKDFVDKVLAK